MPGFVTHYLFGVDACRHMASPLQRNIIKHHHGAYALGLQGPDLFFYHLPSYLMHTENIGALAHRAKTGEFFAHLVESRSIFPEKTDALAIADAYILGFLGHYTLDGVIHPFVYAFTGYSPEHPPKTTDYFGRHACLETEIDSLLLRRMKHMRPSDFHQHASIRMTAEEARVITRMLLYAYRHTYPELRLHGILLAGAPRWMAAGTRMFCDPTGQKKVLVRILEGLVFGHAYLSAMFPSNDIRFVADPMNERHRKWQHPWTNLRSHASFDELYSQALRHFLSRAHAYDRLVRRGFPAVELDAFFKEYGSRSFLSGLPCA